jgi:SecD/SecF fusion protein
LNLGWIIAQAAAAQAAAETPAAPQGSATLLHLLVAVAVVVGSFVLGNFIARRLRMPDYAFKIGLVLFTLSASLVINVMGWPPKRGIDLSGGVVLIYEVERTTSGSMEAAVTRLNEQLAADGGEKLTAQPISSDRLEITLPDVSAGTRVERAVAELRNASELVLHNEGRRTENAKTVLIYSIDRRQQKSIDMNKLIDAIKRRINPSGVKELTIRQYGAEQLEVIIPEIDVVEVDEIKKRISTSGLLEFRIVANDTDDRDLIKAALKSPDREIYLGGHLTGRWVKAGPDLDVPEAMYRETKGRGREILVRIDHYDVDGRYLDRANPDTYEGNPAVHFHFDSVGAEKFGQLTKHNLPDTAVQPPLYRKLGIVLDDVMMSAPRINSMISSDGEISGRFTMAQVEFLVGVLNAGSLPATLNPEPIRQERISSQLGDDTIRSGTMSIGISTAAILLFMAVYYRFCGVVADIAVVLNMVVTVAMMILVKAAFTLPGLAGLVLTVGMAVDANVLIYERMREETERGASLRMAIRNGFGRAMATIIDSHVTTLVSAAVLYMVGTDQIKGFAVTLIIGLLMSLFTAVYVSRVIFDIAEKHRWLTKLNLMHVIGHTNIDFIRWRGPAIAASVIVIVVGLVATVIRGREMLDIDFTGGSSVQILFAEGKEHDIADVRKAVAHLEDVAVSSVGENKLAFKIDTSNRDIVEVQKELQKAFGDSLRTYSMQYGPLETIEKPVASPDAGPDLINPNAAPKQPTEDDEKAPQEGAKAAEESARPAEPETKPAEPAPKPADGDKPSQPDQPQKPDSSAREPNGQPTLQLASAVVDQAFVASLVLAQAEPAAIDAAPKADAPDNAAPKADAPAATPDKPADDAKPTDDAAKPADDAKPAEAATDKPAADEAQAPPSVDSMIGGTRVTLTFPQEISYDPLTAMVQRELAELELKNVRFELHNPKHLPGSDARFNEWTLESTLDKDQTAALVNKIQASLASTPVFPSSNQIGGKVAGDTQLMALYALLASMFIIVVYIWIRFQNVMFGLAAVLALVHDVFITTGFLAMSSYLSPYLGFLLVDPFKISLAVLAALLTIVGFSINDTIVVFDRIREVRGKSPDLTEDMINLSVNATLSRTLLTSGTVMIASVILYFIGGAGIHAFAYAMVVGVVAGTYSSVYIAAPVLLWMKKPAPSSTRTGGAMAAGANK